MQQGHPRQVTEGMENASSPWGDPARLVLYLARLLKDPRVPAGAKLKVAGAGLYAFIDGDLVPDPLRLVPGLGYIDDIILVVHAIRCIAIEAGPFVAADLWPGDPDSFVRTMTAVRWLDDQLYERLRGWVRSLVLRVAGTPQPAGPSAARVEVVR